MSACASCSMRSSGGSIWPGKRKNEGQSLKSRKKRGSHKIRSDVAYEEMQASAIAQGTDSARREVGGNKR
ncbi:MAG: hypothetical protein NVSMB49_16190 [Ktedonobacteraceae bacterium]